MLESSGRYRPGLIRLQAMVDIGFVFYMKEQVEGKGFQSLTIASKTEASLCWAQHELSCQISTSVKGFLSYTREHLHLCVLVAVSEKEEEGICRPVQRCGPSARKGDQWTDTSDEWKSRRGRCWNRCVHCNKIVCVHVYLSVLVQSGEGMPIHMHTQNMFTTQNSR